MPFTPTERRHLLASPGIGPGVLERLQAVGYDSIEKIRRDGVSHAVALIVDSGGTVAWRNRHAALRRALDSLTERSQQLG